MKKSYTKTGSDFYRQPGLVEISRSVYPYTFDIGYPTLSDGLWMFYRHTYFAQTSNRFTRKVKLHHHGVLLYSWDKERGLTVGALSDAYVEASDFAPWLSKEGKQVLVDTGAPFHINEIASTDEGKKWRLTIRVSDDMPNLSDTQTTVDKWKHTYALTLDADTQRNHAFKLLIDKGLLPYGPVKLVIAKTGRGKYQKIVDFLEEEVSI